MRCRPVTKMRRMLGIGGFGRGWRPRGRRCSRGPEACQRTSPTRPPLQRPLRLRGRHRLLQRRWQGMLRRLTPRRRWGAGWAGLRRWPPCHPWTPRPRKGAVGQSGLQSCGARTARFHGWPGHRGSPPEPPSRRSMLARAVLRSSGDARTSQSWRAAGRFRTRFRRLHSRSRCGPGLMGAAAILCDSDLPVCAIRCACCVCERGVKALIDIRQGPALLSINQSPGRTAPLRHRSRPSATLSLFLFLHVSGRPCRWTGPAPGKQEHLLPVSRLGAAGPDGASGLAIDQNPPHHASPTWAAHPPKVRSQG